MVARAIYGLPRRTVRTGEQPLGYLLSDRVPSCRLRVVLRLQDGCDGAVNFFGNRCLSLNPWQVHVTKIRIRLDRPKRVVAFNPFEYCRYGSGPMLGWLVDRKINPHIPVLDKAGRTDGTWSRADFEWDRENNQYICPEGEALKQFRRNYSDPCRGPDGKGVAKYRALKLTCQACPLKAKYCPNADFRSITREEHEDARQVARNIAKTKQYAISMRLRKKVEMLFAHLKRILGLGRLRQRGPCGANDEFLLAAAAQNLRKLAKIFPAPQQTRKA
jgi:Transposase DDE domain